METIIFVPGHGCTSRVFLAQMQALRDRYHCVVIDLCQYNTLEEVIAAILKQAPPKFFILGFSLGAVIALHVSQQVPERIKGLIHISAPYEGPTSVLVQEAKHLHDTLPDMEMLAFAKMAYPKYFPDKKLDDPLYEIFSQMLIETGKKHYLDQTDMLLKPWSLKPEAHDNHPVLILGGAIDNRAVPEYHQTMAQRLKTATLHLLPASRHFVTLEQPALSSQLISKWFNATALS